MITRDIINILEKKFPKINNISVQFLEKIEPKDKTVEELVEETKNNIAKNYY